MLLLVVVLLLALLAAGALLPVAPQAQQEPPAAATTTPLQQVQSASSSSLDPDLNNDGNPDGSADPLSARALGVGLLAAVLLSVVSLLLLGAPVGVGGVLDLGQRRPLFCVCLPALEGPG